MLHNDQHASLEDTPLRGAESFRKFKKKFGINEKLIEGLSPVVRALSAYHRHQVVGLDHIPEYGRVLIVMNHSLATYDMALLLNTIRTEKQRLPRTLIDRLFYKLPYAGDLMNSLGAVKGSQARAKRLLENEELVAVAPGGMKEALKPSSQRYRIIWEQRVGFVKLAMETQTPIIVAVCPKADDLYDIYDNPVTSWAYKRLKVPLFVARGIGLSPLPRPVQLTHFLSEPLVPPKMKDDPRAFEGQLKRYHNRICKKAHELITSALQHNPRVIGATKQ